MICGTTISSRCRPFRTGTSSSTISFQVAFHYSNFDENWKECFEQLRDDPHVVMFVSADDYHEWQFVAQFASSEESEDWRHEFVKEYGNFIAQIDKTAFPTMHKFETSAAVFDDLLRQMDAAEYLPSPETVERGGGIYRPAFGQSVRARRRDSC